MPDRVKPLQWRRFWASATLPTQFAQPALDWLWENHGPAQRQRMTVTHGSVIQGKHQAVCDLRLVVEYVARGANSHDVRRKVWKAATEAAGTPVQLLTVDAWCVAMVELDLTEYLRNDAEWLAGQALSAAMLADRIEATNWDLETV